MGHGIHELVLHMLRLLFIGNGFFQVAIKPRHLEYLIHSKGCKHEKYKRGQVRNGIIQRDDIYLIFFRLLIAAIHFCLYILFQLFRAKIKIVL